MLNIKISSSFRYKSFLKRKTSLHSLLSNLRQDKSRVYSVDSKHLTFRTLLQPITLHPMATKPYNQSRLACSHVLIIPQDDQRGAGISQDLLNFLFLCFLCLKLIIRCVMKALQKRGIHNLSSRTPSSALGST